MYLFKTVVKKSGIEGQGVFADEDILKDAIVWKFDSTHDLSMSQEDYEKLDQLEKNEIRKIGYVSPTSDTWIFPPENDPARYTNHSDSSNNLSAIFDKSKSDEPFFIANRDIDKGEELTNNYREFDESIKHGTPEWMK